MKYHAKLELAGRPQYFWNKTKAAMIEELLIPFVHGQVVTATRGGQTRIINMKSVNVLTIYRTRAKLKRAEGVKIPTEFKSSEFAKRECTKEILKEVQIGSASGAAQSLLQRATATPEPQVFVIMKFGDAALDSAYEGVMKPVIEEYGLKTIRIDEVQNSGRINDQILDTIASSQYVLADLTGERPNCYYECGFAHALGKELILTIRDTDQVHFDLAGYRFIQWSTELDLRKNLRKRFKTLTENGG